MTEDPDLVTSIQKELIDRVMASGRTKSELARIAGLSVKHVNQMLNGRVPGTLNAWEALLWATRQPAERDYECNVCHKTIRRASEEARITSYCESTGRDAKLILKEDSR